MSQAVAEAVLKPGNETQEPFADSSSQTHREAGADGNTSTAGVMAAAKQILAESGQTAAPSAVPTGSLFQIPVASSMDNSGFSYSPLTPLAPISLFFAVCSVTAFFGWYGVAIGGVGVIFGLLALWRIARSNGELSGRALASVATVLSAIGLLGGSAWQYHLYLTELPEGYQRVNFSWLSDQLPVVKDGQTYIHPQVAELDGHDVFIKGYMYPTLKTKDLTEFVLLKDTGQCCFGGNPQLSDMIVVKFKDLKVDFREMQLVSVAGKFHAGTRANADGLSAIYTLDGTHFK